jgi:hypothetical protein
LSTSSSRTSPLSLSPSLHNIADNCLWYNSRINGRYFYLVEAIQRRVSRVWCILDVAFTSWSFRRCVRR